MGEFAQIFLNMLFSENLTAKYVTLYLLIKHIMIV